MKTAHFLSTALLTAISLNLSHTVVNAEFIAKIEATENCQFLQEVTTKATHIRKKIEALVVAENFNTDFAVPTGTVFKSYTAMIKPENDATYDVKINLKYNDGSSSQAYARKFAMTRGETYSLDFASSTNRQPYQINLNVSGDNNNAYTIAVQACK